MTSWVFLVVKENIVTNIKGFSNYWDAAKFADSYIKNSLGVAMEKYPSYNKGENYIQDNISIGVYLVSI